MKASLFLIGLGLAPFLAQAQVFKCVGPDGHTTFSQAPCPDSAGVTTEVQIRASSEPDIPAAQPGNEVARLQAVAGWAYKRYPFLNGESPSANSDAIDEVVSVRDTAVASGSDPAQALLDAIKKVAPRYESAEIMRRNLDAASIMRGQEAAGGKPRVVGIEDSEKAAREARKAAITGLDGDAKDKSEGKPRNTSVSMPDDIIIDARSGQRMDNAAGGYVDPRTGTFYQRVAGGYIETTTGRFIPAQ